MKKESQKINPDIVSNTKRKNKSFSIAGIGASAGGVEAVSMLLEKLPANNGIAYVIILHLDPSLPSFLTEIFQRKTTMPVQAAENGIKVKRNHVYVIPPGTFLNIKDDQLKLSPRGNSNFYHPIDFFFKSLAASYQNKSIGIILSGTATDGTAGLRAIRAEGGITFAQDNTAEFSGMPQSAIDAEIVDFILSPDAIARELTSINKSPVISKSKPEAILNDEDQLGKIFALLRDKKNLDFSVYKRTTLERRLLRRIALNKVATLKEYVAKLEDDDAECDQLYNDLLINVTDFFRDENAFAAIPEDVFTTMVNNPGADEGLRIWITACSTGEEAYSVAISLWIFLDEHNLSIPFHIFATDANQYHIEKARKGLFPQSSLLNVSPEILKKYFIKCSNGHYQIKDFIRNNCVFSTHNLLSDPPFSKVDLISCQNMLIYLNANAQYKILQSFHYALNPQGFLWLGKSESIGEAEELFQKIEGNLKIFNKKDGLSHLPFYFFSGNNKKRLTAERKLIKAKNQFFPRETDVEKENDRLLLSKYVTPSVLITNDWKIIRFNGSISNFLQPATGKASLHLLKMIKDDFLVDLRTVINTAKESGIPSRKEGILFNSNNKSSLITLEAVPLHSSSTEKYFLVLFIEEPSINTKSKKLIKDISDNKRHPDMLRMEQELNEARNQLKYITQEFENSREDLQTANEEVLSSNEELQSINEELETSKEELQSTNEELVVSNEELIQRNAELKDAFEYRQGIVETIHEPLVVMNAEMKIISANRAFYEHFQTSEGAVRGQSFFEIENKQWNNPELKKQLSAIISKKASFKNIEITSQFPLLGRRTLVYNCMRMYTESGSKNQFLLVIEDITERRRVEEELKGAHKSNLKVLNSISDIFMSINNNWQFIFINKTAEKYLGKKLSEVMGKNIWDVVPSFGGSAFHANISESMQTRKFSEFDIYYPKNKEWYNYRIYPTNESLSIFSNNVTEHQRTIDLVKQSKERYETFISKSAEGIWRFEIENPIPINLTTDEQLRQLLLNARLAECNSVIAERYGYSKPSDLIGLSLNDLFKNSELYNYLTPFIESKYRLNDVQVEEELQDGNSKYYLNNLVGIIENDCLIRIWGTKRDISEQKEVELSLLKAQKKLNLALSESSIATWIWDIKEDRVEWSKEQRLLYGSMDCSDICSFASWLSFIHPEDSKEVESNIIIAKNNRKEIEAEFRVIFPDESIHWLLLKGSLKFDKEGNPLEMVGVNIDITDRKLLEKEREGFIAIASHELKTPLTSIKAYAEILTEVLQEKNDQKAASLSLKMEKQIDRLHNLIKELLDVTILGEGQLQLKPGFFDFNKMTREVVEDMQSTTSKHRLITDINIPQKAWGDPNKLREVLINFISNAIKYSPSSEKVMIKAWSDEDTINVAVKDNGIGLSKQEMAKLFTRFYRVNTSTTNTFPGLGLGLFISAEIIKKHNGKVWVESTKGLGSQFFFSIPLENKMTEQALDL